MTSEEDGRAHGPHRFEGEDTSPTSPRELMGWYTYGLSAEIFAICGVGSFLPVTLEQLARERGVWWSDKTTPCIGAASNSESHARMLARATDNEQCIVRIFGTEVTTASFAMYTFSAAVFIQALTLASFSSVADYGPYRRKMLLGFGYFGSLVTMLFIFIIPSIYYLAPLLVVIGVTSLGCSFVLLNSFLPLLAANHPDIEVVKRDSQSYSPGLEQSSRRKTNSPEIQMSTRISSKGVGIGYAAALGVQVLSIGVLAMLKKLTNSRTLPLRIVVFMSGAWWFVGTIPTQLWLRDRPGPPLKAIDASRNKLLTALKYVRFSWASLWKTLKIAIQLRQTVVFLVAWFLLSDAVATISGTAVLFARTELHMGTIAIALLSITVTSSGIAGAFCWPIISRHFRLATNHTIIACILLMEIIPIYGLLGYLPFIQSWGFGGLQQAWEIYPLGVVHGFVMGGLSSYCRSFYGNLIPPGSEAAFYALYAITDKGSSAVGPTVVGKIVDLTGHIRPAFIFLSVLILLPAPLVWYIDVSQGRQDAVMMAEKIKRSGGEEVELTGRTEGIDWEAEGLLSSDDDDEDD